MAKWDSFQKLNHGIRCFFFQFRVQILGKSWTASCDTNRQWCCVLDDEGSNGSNVPGWVADGWSGTVGACWCQVPPQSTWNLHMLDVICYGTGLFRRSNGGTMIFSYWAKNCHLLFEWSLGPVWFALLSGWARLGTSWWPASWVWPSRGPRETRCRWWEDLGICRCYHPQGE
jgi:hypothetical protein